MTRTKSLLWLSSLLLSLALTPGCAKKTTAGTSTTTTVNIKGVLAVDGSAATPEGSTVYVLGNPDQKATAAADGSFSIAAAVTTTLSSFAFLTGASTTTTVTLIALKDATSKKYGQQKTDIAVKGSAAVWAVSMEETGSIAVSAQIYGKTDHTGILVYIRRPGSRMCRRKSNSERRPQGKWKLRAELTGYKTPDLPYHSFSRQNDHSGSDLHAH